MPTIWVAPVRSHCSPITISPFDCAIAGPAKPSAVAAPIARPSIVADTRFMPVPPLLDWSIREWPHPEVIADIAPQAVQAFRLDHQEKDDQAAEQDEPQIGDRVQQIGLREQQPAV